MERTNLMQPGAGHPIRGGAINIVLKVGADDSTQTSVFELTVVPGFDVGAHVHTAIEETFYVLEGSLNLQVGDETGTGIGPGSFMFVPKGAGPSLLERHRQAGQDLVHLISAGPRALLRRAGRDFATSRHARCGRDPFAASPLRHSAALRPSSIEKPYAARRAERALGGKGGFFWAGLRPRAACSPTIITQPRLS